MECPYCHHQHYGENFIGKSIHCKYKWQNKELMAMMKASKRLGELESSKSIKNDIEQR